MGGAAAMVITFSPRLKAETGLKNEERRLCARRLMAQSFSIRSAVACFSGDGGGHTSAIFLSLGIFHTDTVRRPSRLADASFSKRDFYEEPDGTNPDRSSIDQPSRDDCSSLAASCTRRRRLAGAGSH